MVRASLLVRFAICATAFALAVPTLSAQTPRAAAPAPVQARYTKVTDALGFAWDVNSNGGITRGSNCFNSAFSLILDGNDINLTSGKMTPDGQEYFFTGEYEGIHMSRRVRVNLKDSYCRFIETLTNTSSEAHSIQFAIRVRFSGRMLANGGDSGDRPFPFEEKEVGVVIGGAPKTTTSATPQPTFIWMLASRGAKIRPTVRIEQSTFLTATYPVTLAPGASISLVHAGAQRTLAEKPTVKSVGDLFRPMTSTGIFANLPAKEWKNLANFKPVTDDEGTAGPGLPALQALLEASEISREKADALMVEPGAIITGKISGGDIAIETEFGKAKVAFADIAAIAGGGGVGRTPRVFLRDGEVLCGAISAEKITMTAGSGLSLEIDPALIQVLSLGKDALDGKPPEGAAVLLSTLGGDCLALTPDGTSALEVATPWGVLRASLAEIAGLSFIRDPFPGHRLALADGSRLPVMLRGGEWQVATTRFGAVKIAPQSVRDIRNVRAKAPPTEDESGGRPGGFPGCELTGENRLAGAIDLPALHLASAKNTTPLDPKTMAILEREAGEDGATLVKIKLADGQEVSGRLVESILPIRSADRVWRVPVSHILSVNVPPPEKPKEEPVPPAPAPKDYPQPVPLPPSTDEVINAPPNRPPLPAPKSPATKP